MNSIALVNAVSNLDEEILNTVLQQRFCNMSTATAKKRFGWIKPHFNMRLASAVTAFAVCMLVVLGTANYLYGLRTTPGTATVPSTTTPGYVPNYSTPDLETLYQTAPFSQLLPRQLLPFCTELASSYLTEYDPIANPDSRLFLRLCFTGQGALQIDISEITGQELLADPTDPTTYDLSYYYAQAKKPGFVPADLPNFAHTFYAEDLTAQIVDARVYTIPGSGCKAELSLICGDHVVSYHYYGAKITGQEFYNLILSSDCFVT